MKAICSIICVNKACKLDFFVRALTRDQSRCSKVLHQKSIVVSDSSNSFLICNHFILVTMHKAYTTNTGHKLVLDSKQGSI